MAIFSTKLVKKEVVADGTMAFYFEKPQDFTFTAGQYLQLTLKNIQNPDTEGIRRDFSITSAPQEAWIMITTRMRDSSFKNYLKDMSSGEEGEVNGPMGSFVLHEDQVVPAVLIAGGVGITPLRSIIVDALARGVRTKIYLFYSNRQKKDAAFLDELEALAKDHPNFKFVPTFTQQEWEGEKGYVKQEMLQKYVEDLSLPIFYTAGPPAMVEAMVKMLKEAGISRDKIRSEDFGGY